MPTVPLAAFDFVPVILAGFAFVTIARLVAVRNPALGPIAMAGAILATAGGASKATWKLIYAAGGPDIDIMEEALFPLLSAGFALLALSLFQLREEGSAKGSAVGLVAIIWGTAIGLSFVGEGAVSGFFISAVTIAEVVFIILLWRWARREGTHIGWYVGIHLFLVIGLSGMASAVEQTNALQWVEETSNAVTQGLLLLAALKLKAAIESPAEETADVA